MIDKIKKYINKFQTKYIINYHQTNFSLVRACVKDVKIKKFQLFTVIINKPTYLVLPKDLVSNNLMYKAHQLIQPFGFSTRLDRSIFTLLG